MRYLGCFLILLFASGFSHRLDNDVYICVSKTASKYHFDRDCRGLRQCTHTIEKVTLKKAKAMGYDELCGWED